jgi:hypothetical protein
VVPLLGRDVEHPARRRAARVGDHNVERAVARPHAVHQVGGRGRDGEVAHLVVHPADAVAERRRGFRERRRRAAGEHHAVPAGEQRGRAGRADAPGSTADEGDAGLVGLHDVSYIRPMTSGGQG